MPTILLYTLGLAILTFTAVTVRYMLRNELIGAVIRLRTAISESGDFPTPPPTASGSGAQRFTASNSGPQRFTASSSGSQRFSPDPETGDLA